MIQITPQMRIFLAVEPVDFRKASTAWPRFVARSSSANLWMGRCLSSPVVGDFLEDPGLRRARILVVPKATFPRPFPVVAAR